MKRFTVISLTVLALAAFASLASCKGGTFSDPGHEAASGGGGNDIDYGDWGDWDDYDDYDDDDKDNNTGTGNGTGTGNDGKNSASKPALLSNSATYSQALAKLDEIIAYCDSHPGMINNSVKYSVDQLRSPLAAYTNNTWSPPTSTTAINALNLYIGQLQ
jgi:hypothetical protein